MQTPATAMVWELWRLTRREMFFRLAIVVGLASAVLIVKSGDRGEVVPVVFFLVVAQATMTALWAKNVDNQMGFPFYLGFTRPIPTWLLVIVPMAYLGVVSAVSYLIPAIVLRAAFTIPLPLAPVAAPVAAVTLVFAACIWWSRDKVAQSAGLIAALGCLYLGYRKHFAESGISGDLDSRIAALSDPNAWMVLFQFSWAEYSSIALVAAAAIAMAVYGVERQRHGDDSFSVRRKLTLAVLSPAGMFSDSLRIPCPISSPTLAQLWMEMKRQGVPILALGVATALLIPPFLFVAKAYDFVLIGMMLALLSLMVPLFAGLAWIFGLRRKQGSTDMSTFEATRALGTARLVGLKVFVTVTCMLGAWIAIGTSLWASAPIVGDVFDFGWIRQNLTAILNELPGYWTAALAIVALVQLSATVACLGTFQVFNAIYPRRVLVCALSFGSYFLVLAFAIAGEWVGATVVEAHAWIIAAVVPLGAVYMFREVLKDRIFTPRLTVATFLVWMGYAAAYFALLYQSGMFQSEMALAFLALLVSLSLAPLGSVALAPWSLGLIRHR